jgi:hypothetical protein
MEVNYPGMTAKQIAITQILQVLAQRVLAESESDELVERGLEFQVFEAAVKEEFSY